MATRKVKHARAVAKHEKFMADLHMEEQKYLKIAQKQRSAERKAEEEKIKERKTATSKRLAKAHRGKPAAPKKAS